MPLVTDASPFDGLLDVLVAPAISKMRPVAWPLGTLVRAPGCGHTVVVRRATQVTITQDARHDDVRVLPPAVPLSAPGGREE